MPASKAKAAAKATRSTLRKNKARIRTKTHFYKPKTLKMRRNPKYANKSTVSRTQMDKLGKVEFG